MVILYPRLRRIDRDMSRAAGEAPATEEGLESLTGLLHAAEGWFALRAALDAGHSGTIDGTWGSSAALAVAALADDAPTTVVRRRPIHRRPRLMG
jgi:transcription-repair coupling factor (superfamily II helicase)